MMTQGPSTRGTPTRRVAPGRSRAEYAEHLGLFDASVASAMRFPTIVTASTPLSHATELLLREGVSLLVVVDERRRPLGVVLPADVLGVARRRPAGLRSATALDAARSGGRFMPEGTSLRTAAAALLEENRDFFVVVDPDGRLSGTISAMDVLQARWSPTALCGRRARRLSCVPSDTT